MNYMSGNNRQETFIIAELSCNHLQDFDLAKKTILAASEAGANALKLQTDNPDGGITIKSSEPAFIIASGTPWDGQSLYELYKKTYTPWEWHQPLLELIASLNMVGFSTPSDPKGVDFLESLGVPIYKIASFEITDIPLIEYAATKGKPMIISTGIADICDIQAAVEACRRVGNNNITLLQCTSSYPAPAEMANLQMIPNLAETFGVTSGLSDHTLGTAVAVAAVALGATMVEKHIILDRKLGGPDSEFSVEPTEFKKMVDDIRTVERALGCVDYSMTEKKLANRKLSRSLFVVEDIMAGDYITSENVRSIRPSDGLHPRHLSSVIGKQAVRNLTRGEPLGWEMIS